MVGGPIVRILFCLAVVTAAVLAIIFICQKNQRAYSDSLEDMVLAAGDRMPHLEAEGWLNSAPALPGTGGAKVLVLDLWAHW